MEIIHNKNNRSRTDKKNKRNTYKKREYSENSIHWFALAGWSITRVTVRNVTKLLKNFKAIVEVKSAEELMESNLI